MLGSLLGYFFSIITVFATVTMFMTLLIGVFDNSAFEKLRHYPRPIIERSAPAPPILEPHRIPNPERHRPIKIQRILAPPLVQKQTPKIASLNENLGPKGLRSAASLAAWPFMRSTAS